MSPHLLRFEWLPLALLVCAAPSLLADTTIRYHTETRHAAGLPAAFEAHLKALSQLPPDSVLRVKDNKIVTTGGGFTIIFDSRNQAFTIVDPAHKTSTLLQFSDMADFLAAALPAARISPLPGRTPQVETRTTGRTDMIQGVQAEEREMTVSWTPPALPGRPDNAHSVVWLSRIWSARPAETARVPAIRELTDLWTGKQAQILDAFFGKLPILGPEIAAVLKQPPIILRAHFELSARPAIESDAPLVQMDQVVTELSDAPVDPSIFEVPQDYRALPPEMVRAALRMAAAKRAAAASPPPPPGGAPSSAALAGGVIGGIIGSVPVGAPPPSPVEVSPAGPVPMRIRVDGNVQQAKLIRQPKPVYPPLARQARISGVVRLRVIIAKDGTIENLTLISGHPLLVPAAMQAVKQWVYQPTLLNGEPVAVLTQVEVNFELSNSDAPANHIVNRSSGKCLGVRDGGVVQQVACEGAPFWERRPSGEIVAALSHGCLQADGSALRVDTCQGGDNQQWEVRATGEILHTAGGMCLEAQGAASENKVALLSCSAGDNQKWEIGPGRP